MQSIERLRDTPKSELLKMWGKLPGRHPPPGRVDRLVRELAYRLQEQRHGRLDKNTAVSLRRHMNTFEQSLGGSGSDRSIGIASKLVLEAGSVLTREWNGTVIRVQVLGARQFEHDGVRYRSLSAVARKITGQHLSGPLFFGLKEVNYA